MKTTNRLSAALIISALLASGCSGSGSSQTSGSTDSANTSAREVVVGGGPDGSETTGSAGTDGSLDTGTIGEGTTGGNLDSGTTGSGTTGGNLDSGTTGSSTAGGETTSGDTALADSTADVSQEPVVQNSTRVSFDITVPAYKSNELRVRLVWGEMDVDAQWVVDEYWIVSEDFPKETENLLVVIFYDGNGATTLGSFQQSFKTSSGESEIVTITADQFDTERWDSDSDGESNLNESIAGTDPLFDDRIDNDELLALLPEIQTLFGQSISSIPNPDRSYDHGLLVWEYDVVNDQLVNRDYVAPDSHKLGWQRYVELTLPEDREIITKMKFLYGGTGNSTMYLVTISPTKVPGGAHVELQLSESFVSLLYSVKQAGAPNVHWQTMDYIHIHGHTLKSAEAIAFFEEYDVPTYSLGGAGNRVMWDSFMREYYQTFWEGDIYNTYVELRSTDNHESAMRAKYPDEFVSWFAARSPSSDFAESFEYFIDQAEMPSPGEYSGSKKLIWFWNQPRFVNIREYARAAF